MPQRYYGVILICILNLINMIGFSILNCILGGQALASVVNGQMSWRYVLYPTCDVARSHTYSAASVGIVVISMISLVVSFFGITVLNWWLIIQHLEVLKFNGCYRYERISWFPVLITLVIASAIGGKHLFNPPSATPATASNVLSFASTLAGFSITYSPLSSDFTSYYRPNVSR